jgi:microcompartment protein CcmK/EutM
MPPIFDGAPSFDRSIEKGSPMKIKTVGIVAGMWVLIALAPASLAAAAEQTPANPLAQQLAGSWQLVSITVDNTEPYGASPQGSMIVGAGNHFAVIVMSGGNARSISYYGTYALDPATGVMTLHIDGSTLPNEAGQDHRRLLTFAGDQLTQQSLLASGSPGPITMVWKRSP